MDFGKIVVGFIGFTIDAPEGVLLDFNLFEAYEDGKPIYKEGLRNALRYKTKKGLQKFLSPKRQEFRYLKLTVRNLEKPLTIYELYCNLSTYPVSLQGEFATSDYNLNVIYEMSRYTTRLCMEDTYIDCPTYEQTYWVGDARNEALIARTAFGDTRLTERCLRLVGSSLKRSIRTLFLLKKVLPNRIIISLVSY